MAHSRCPLLSTPHSQVLATPLIRAIAKCSPRSSLAWSRQMMYPGGRKRILHPTFIGLFMPAKSRREMERTSHSIALWTTNSRSRSPRFPELHGHLPGGRHMHSARPRDGVRLLSILGRRCPRQNRSQNAKGDVDITWPARANHSIAH